MVIEIIVMHFRIILIPFVAFAYIFPTVVNVNEILDKHNRDENGKYQQNWKQYNSLWYHNWKCCAFVVFFFFEQQQTVKQKMCSKHLLIDTNNVKT